MNTLVVIKIGLERWAFEYKNASHRIIYRKTLRAINNNDLFERKVKTTLKEIVHQKANFTEMQLLLNDTDSCTLHIHTINE